MEQDAVDAQRFEWFFTVWTILNVVSNALTKAGWIAIVLQAIFG
jgi:hypothetical protein